MGWSVDYVNDRYSLTCVKSGLRTEEERTKRGRDNCSDDRWTTNSVFISESGKGQLKSVDEVVVQYDSH